jgi:hypothetical protein
MPGQAQQARSPTSPSTDWSLKVQCFTRLVRLKILHIQQVHEQRDIIAAGRSADSITLPHVSDCSSRKQRAPTLKSVHLLFAVLENDRCKGS